MNKIRECRQAKSLSIDALARLCGISKSYLYKLEKTKGINPSFSIMSIIANALNVQVEYLDGRSTDIGRSDLPTELLHATQRYRIPPQDADELAQIRFFGAQPSSASDWHLLWEILRRTCM